LLRKADLQMRSQFVMVEVKSSFPVVSFAALSRSGRVLDTVSPLRGSERLGMTELWETR
jgi:hypothetical protein